MSEDETCPPSMSSVADSLARTSATPERGLDSPAIEVGSGMSTHESFAKWNPDTSSWKTSQHSLLEDLTTFSERWPIAGTMRNGRVFVHSTWAPRISETDYSLLPTPRAIYGEHPGMLDPNHLTGAVHLWPTPDTGLTPNGHGRRGGKPGNGRQSGASLEAAVRMWPTPHANCSTGAGTQGRKGGLYLQPAAKLWTTPTADDTAHRREKYAQGGTALSTQAGGQLNPTWVEWLMGFPPEWTVLEPSATPSSRKSRKSSAK